MKNMNILQYLYLSCLLELSAKYIASQVGIDYYVSGLLPDGKLYIINRLKKHGSVMMVGDGINDAPALELADVGVEGAAQARVGREADNAHPFQLALSRKRGGYLFVDRRGVLCQHLGQFVLVRKEPGNAFFGLVQLGCRDHLHRRGYLLGRTDRIDAFPDFFQ